MPETTTPHYEFVKKVSPLRPPFHGSPELKESSNLLDRELESLHASISGYEQPFAFLQEIAQKMESMGQDWLTEFKDIQSSGELDKWYSQARAIALMEELSTASLEELVSSDELKMVKQVLQNGLAGKSVYSIPEVLQVIFGKNETRSRQPNVSDNLRSSLNAMNKPNLVWQAGLSLRDRLNYVNAYANVFPKVNQKIKQFRQRDNSLTTKENITKEDMLIKDFESLLIVIRLRNLAFSERRRKIERIKTWSPSSNSELLRTYLKDIFRLTGLAHALGVIVDNLLTKIATSLQISPIEDQEATTGEITSNEANLKIRAEAEDELKLSHLLEVFDALASLTNVNAHKDTTKSMPVAPGSPIFINYLKGVFTELLKGDIPAARRRVVETIEKYHDSYSPRMKRQFAPDIALRAKQAELSLDQDGDAKHIQSLLLDEQRRRQLTDQTDVQFFRDSIGTTFKFTLTKTGEQVFGEILGIVEHYPMVKYALTKDREDNLTIVDLKKALNNPNSDLNRDKLMQSYGIKKIPFVKVAILDMKGNSRGVKLYYPGILKSSIEWLNDVE